MEKSNIKVIGLGGCGSNVLKNVIDTIGSMESDNLGKFEYYNLDTSLNNKINGSTFYRIGTNAGSGGLRGMNVSSIRDGIEKFITNNVNIEKDSREFFIIINSLSGGTGSVISPLLYKRLVELNKGVALITIADTTQYQYSVNSLDTIKSYYGISTKTGIIPILYLDNGDYDNIKESNRFITQSVLSLGFLLSGVNRDIDNMDAKVFLHPTMLKSKFKSIPSSGLAFMDILYSDDIQKYVTKPNSEYLEPAQTESILGARLLTKADYQTPSIKAVYFKHGFYNKDEETAHNILFVTKVGGLNNLVKELESKIKKNEVVFTDDSIDLQMDDDELII